MLPKVYLEWLPYQKTIDRAKIFFINGDPFNRLDNNQRGVMGEYHKIRNAIAHKSLKAQSDFDRVIQNRRLG